MIGYIVVKRSNFSSNKKVYDYQTKIFYWPFAKKKPLQISYSRILLQNTFQGVIHFHILYMA